jgi:hypothetical protein
VRRIHKINHGWYPSKDREIVIDDRYQAELDQARARAEKAWRNAEKALAKAQRMELRRPEPATVLARKDAERLVGERLAELQRIHDLMRHTDGTKGTRHSGRGAVTNVTSVRRLP